MEEGQLIKLPCACKNLPIHPACLKEWLKCCPDILTCGVCKKDLDPSFIKQFVNVEDLWMYPKSPYISDVPNMPNMHFRHYVGMPGVPYAELVNGKMIFESDHKKSVFLEAEKRWHMGERRTQKYYQTSRKNKRSMKRSMKN